MGDQRGGGIAWTEYTWNCLRGCSKVSEGCRNCYAIRVAARFSGPGMPYEGLASRNPDNWTGEIRLIERALTQPLKWNRPRLVFVNSMSDVFHENVPDEWIDLIFAVMWMAERHTFQILTKRHERMYRYLTDKNVLDRIMGAAWRVDPDRAKTMTLLQEFWPLRNVWLGVSVEDQESYDSRLECLVRSPAVVRWLSVEPLIGPIALGLIGTLPGTWTGGAYRLLVDRLQWIVVGGESGPGARPMDQKWVGDLLLECKQADVPFFFKQGSENGWSDFKNYDAMPELFRVRQWPKEWMGADGVGV